ncbi:MAG: radical SAM family heme chaperone HemW [Bacteroidota bacterium]
MTNSPGGIYVHIPYCRKACVYCDFHFMTNLRNKEAMVQAIAKEAAQRKDFFEGSPLLGTLYFGGGTPSVLTAAEIGQLIGVIRQHFSFAEGAEITLEANPDDLSLPYLQGIRTAGINRLSIGVQSFREADLQWMNRTHSADQAVQSILFARKAGFDNLSIDLIFGLPGSDRRIWQDQLAQVVALQVPHLSLYALTVEEKTALAHQVQKGMTRIPDDPLFTEQFLLAHERLEGAGYEHYELSNYALASRRSRHNSAYWQGKPYLGLGPSAHSYNGTERIWNVANNQGYMKAFAEGVLPIDEREMLSLKDRYHEYVMTQLRKREGIDMDQIETQFIANWRTQFGPYLAELMAEGLAQRQGSRFWLTPLGWMLSDEIIRELFV